MTDFEAIWANKYKARVDTLPHNRKRETVSEIRDIILSAHNDGFPALTIGRLMGKDHTTILHHLWAMGIDYRNEKRVERARILEREIEEREKREAEMKLLAELRAKKRKLKAKSTARWNKIIEKSSADKKKAQQLYKKGVPLKQIALETGRSVANIHAYVRTIPNFRAIQRKRVNGVKQISGNGETIAVYPTISSASAATGIDSSTISRCISGFNLTAGGYRWERAKKV